MTSLVANIVLTGTVCALLPWLSDLHLGAPASGVSSRLPGAVASNAITEAVLATGSVVDPAGMGAKQPSSRQTTPAAASAPAEGLAVAVAPAQGSPSSTVQGTQGGDRIITYSAASEGAANTRTGIDPSQEDSARNAQLRGNGSSLASANRVAVVALPSSPVLAAASSAQNVSSNSPVVAAAGSASNSTTGSGNQSSSSGNSGGTTTSPIEKGRFSLPVERSIALGGQDVINQLSSMSQSQGISLTEAGQQWLDANGYTP